MEITQQWVQEYVWLILLVSFWDLLWKGLALWKAARKNDRAWFAALLLINSLGLLPIFYTFVFSRQTKDDHK